MQTDLTLRHWLRNRPATLKVFEELAGHGIWKELDATLPVFCRSFSLQILDVHNLLLATTPATEHEDWLAKPLYLLIDHLTANHTGFRESDLPKIERLLDILKLEMGMASAPVEEAHAHFRSFRQEFTWHMDEEETFLFPKIMRTEACLRYPELYPEVFKGSVSMFPPAQIRLPEEAFHEMLGALMQKVRAVPMSHVHTDPMHELLGELVSYGSKLKAHTYLETDILFRRAAKMEEVLLKRSSRSQG